MIARSFAYRLMPAMAVCLALEETRLFAQDTDLPEPIRFALLHYTDLESLAVTCTQSVEATSMGREKIAPEVLGKILADQSCVQQLAFHSGRIYVRRETNTDTSWPPRTQEFAFDRQLFYTANNLFYVGERRNREREDRPYLRKWLPKNDQPEATYFQNDYFRAAGIRIPIQIKELVQNWRPQSEVLALLAQGGRVGKISQVNLEGHPLVRVPMVGCKIQEHGASPQQIDFYMDPQRSYAVRRLESRDAAGRLLVRSDCTDFEQLSGRLIWMPRLCRVEEYLYTGAKNDNIEIPYISPSPLYIKNIRVIGFELQPWPEDRFQLKYTTSGAYVNDASFPEIKGTEGVFYQVPANPQRLDELIAARRALYQGWMNAEKRSRPLQLFFLGLNGIGLAGLTVYLIARRRGKASNP